MERILALPLAYRKRVGEQNARKVLVIQEYYQAPVFLWIAVIDLAKFDLTFIRYYDRVLYKTEYSMVI
jgi:hypothetical protein